MLGELDEFLPEDVLEKLDEVKSLNKEKKINKVGVFPHHQCACKLQL